MNEKFYYVKKVKSSEIVMIGKFAYCGQYITDNNKIFDNYIVTINDNKTVLYVATDGERYDVYVSYDYTFNSCDYYSFSTTNYELAIKILICLVENEDLNGTLYLVRPSE